MKRLFILASAAALMLASCAKTTVVYNEAPEEIGFKAVTGVMTKAGVQTLGENTTMGVFADITDGDNLFTNISFAPDANADNVWVASPKQYWPLGDGKLNFAVYAPWDNTANVITWNKSESKLSIEVTNGTVGSQKDWLYGKTFYESTSKSNSGTSVTLRHALAKIVVSIKSDLSGLVITSLTIKQTEQNETMSVAYKGEGKDDDNYADGDARVEWTNTGAPVDMNIISDAYTFDNSSTPKEANCYVIPSAQTSIQLKYKLSSNDTEKTYTHSLTSLGSWYGGYKYTYDIDIAANEIKFNPTIDDWTDGVGASPDITPNDQSNQSPVE